MNKLPFKYKNRREFIKSCFRFMIGGGLVFTGIALGNRKKTVSIENGLCQLNTPCHGCSEYYGCNLPQAITVKKEQNPEGGNSGR